MDILGIKMKGEIERIFRRENLKISVFKKNNLEKFFDKK
jgi:hypothetical protein